VSVRLLMDVTSPLVLASVPRTETLKSRARG
jgi:hypothetical protein